MPSSFSLHIARLSSFSLILKAEIERRTKLLQNPAAGGEDGRGQIGEGSGDERENGVFARTRHATGRQVYVHGHAFPPSSSSFLSVPTCLGRRRSKSRGRANGKKRKKPRAREKNEKKRLQWWAVPVLASVEHAGRGRTTSQRKEKKLLEKRERKESTERPKTERGGEMKNKEKEDV